MRMVVVGVISAGGILPISAELPIMSKPPWLGYFIGVESNRLQFGITPDGKAVLKVRGKNGDSLNKKLAVSVNFLVEETLPDGKITVKSIIPESLESAQPTTDKPKKVVFHGKVKGEAAFEVFVDEDRGGVLLGGRLINEGTLTKNPTRFSIQFKFPDAYPNDKRGGDKKQIKEFKDKIGRDNLQFTWIDGKRVKLPNDKPVDAGQKETNGPGIKSAQIEFSTYEGRKFELTASENSSMTLSNSGPAPLHEGFSIIWTADPVKDPEGKARLIFTVK